MKRYVVKAQYIEDRQHRAINYYDDLGAAIERARSESKNRDAGTAEYIVLDLRTDSIKYRRGWIDRSIARPDLQS